MQRILVYRYTNIYWLDRTKLASPLTPPSPIRKSQFLSVCKLISMFIYTINIHASFISPLNQFNIYLLKKIFSMCTFHIWARGIILSLKKNPLTILLTPFYR